MHSDMQNPEAEAHRVCRIDQAAEQVNREYTNTDQTSQPIAQLPPDGFYSAIAL